MIFQSEMMLEKTLHPHIRFQVIRRYWEHHIKPELVHLIFMLHLFQTTSFEDLKGWNSARLEISGVFLHALTYGHPIDFKAFISHLLPM